MASSRLKKVYQKAEEDEDDKESSEGEEGKDEKGSESGEDEKESSEGEEDEDDEGGKSEEGEDEKKSSEGESSDDEVLTNYVSKVVLKKPKVKKAVCKSDSDSKEQRAKKQKRVPTTNKRKRVSESDSLVEEEKVSKPKISMKKERVVKIEEKVSKKVLKPKKEVSKKRKSEPNEKKKKPLSAEQIEKIEYLSEFPALLSRTVPASLFSTIRDARVDMESFLADIGFSSLYGVNIETLPSRIARFVVENFDKETYKLSLENGEILVTPEKIHEILGVPLGGISFFELAERSLEDPFVIMWLKQFSPKKWKDIRASDVAGKLITATQVDFMFKVNFLTLFSNVMAKAHTMKALVDLTIVRRISEDAIIANIDWCGYIYDLLKDSEIPNTPKGFYNGALCFLILLYFDSTKFERFPVIRYRPAIRNWSSSLMHQRQKLEIEQKDIGKLELHGKWSESEVQATEGFYDRHVKVSQAHSSRVPPTDKQSFCTMINEKLSSICREKVELEDLLKNANTVFPNDEDVLELYKKYGAVFKETVILEEVHVDDFDPEDQQDDGSNDRGKKDVGGAKKDVGVDKVVPDNVDAASKDVGGAKKDGDNVEEGVQLEGSDNDVSEDPILSQESYTQWIEHNIDWVGEVIDCICDAYYDDDFPNWPRIVQPVNSDCPQTPERVATRSSPKKRIVKPSSYLSSPYENKPTKVIAMVKRIEFELGNSLFAMQGDKMETVFQTRSGDHEVSAVRLNMETLAPSLWIDNNVVDCWGAVLNYEESAKKDPSPKKTAKKDQPLKRHFFPTGCITEAMVGGKIGKNEQWDIFSAEILAHLKNVNASKFLAEIDLAFFPIQVFGHFYVVVFNIRSGTSMVILDNSPQNYAVKYKGACDILRDFFAKILFQYRHPKADAVLNARARVLQLKWKTKNNHVDYGVFAMIHMESYVGETAGKWDVGLCKESEMQVSLLRRMRFKIATKILLHELNLHSQKMFDLAFKFQSEIDEQTRFSIILNAIKNRADRDPPKDVCKENVVKIDDK